MLVVQNRLGDLLADKMKREQRPISIAEIARACGLSRQSAHKWVNNKIKSCRFETLAAFCEYFDCAPGDLIIVQERDQAS